MNHLKLKKKVIKMKDKPDVGLLVFCSESTLEHKKIDGFKDSGDYVFWYGSKVPKKIVELLPDYANFDRESYSSDKLLYYILDDGAIDVKDYDIRLYFQVDGKIRGYFKISAFQYGDKSYELRFWSDDWVKIKNGESKKGHQGWEYYPKEGCGSPTKNERN